jgi:hypothetical protein
MDAIPELLLRARFGDDVADFQAVAARFRRSLAADESFDELLRRKFSSLSDDALRGDLETGRAAAGFLPRLPAKGA